MATVFVSYANEDTSEGRWIADALAVAGHEVFFAPDRIRGGATFNKVIGEALEQADFAVILASEAGRCRVEVVIGGSTTDPCR